jgi:peroxiredoxin
MTIKVGDRIPDVEVRIMDGDSPKPVRTGELLGTGTVVLFGVPGAFTPGCSKIHLPGYVRGADELRAKGVDKIVCMAVNDPWVMQAWAEAQGAGDKVIMISDGNAEFTRALGLEWDGSVAGLGVRCRRFAAILKDGVVTELEVEPNPGVSVSACENILAKL